MNAPVLMPSFDDAASTVGLRFVEVPDDHLEPTLRRRDFVLLQPVEHYAGEGIYLIRDGVGGLASYRVAASIGRGTPRLHLWCENEFYRLGDRDVTPEAFAAVVGKAAMTCRVLDHHAIHRVLA